MKRVLFFVVLAVSLLIIGKSGLLADTPLPFVETFNSYNTGDDPDNWEPMNAIDGAAATIVEGILGANGKCLKMEKPGQNAFRIRNGWNSPNPANLIVEYRLRISAFPTLTSPVPMLYISPPGVIEDNSWGEGGVCIAMQVDSLLNNNAAWLPLQVMEIEKWYDITYDIDMQKGIFDVYIDGELKTDKSVFRGTTATIENTKCIWIFAESMSAFYDDIFIYDASGSHPRPVETVDKLPVSWGKLKSLN